VELPPYDAVIEFEPTANVDVLYVAFPLLSVPVPRVVLPFLNVTVPVAADGVTVAVKVTEEPYVDGFEEEATVVEVEVFAKTTPAKKTQLTSAKARDIVRIDILHL
jgi:hypothetical protein